MSPDMSYIYRYLVPLIFGESPPCRSGPPVVHRFGLPKKKRAGAKVPLFGRPKQRGGDSTTITRITPEK